MRAQSKWAATGLTSTYITSNGGTVGTGWSLKSYSAALFQGATITSSTALPPGGVNSTLTDGSGNVFSMINSGTAGQNFWASPGAAGATSIVIPTLNVANVTGVDILLNDYAGYAGSGPTITFTFSDSSTDTETITDLANGAGAIRSAVDCTSTTGTGLTCPNPATTPAGNTVSASLPTTTNTTALFNDSVKTSAIWSGTYTIAAGANSGASDYFYSATAGSSGSVMLDELAFTFSNTYKGKTLTSITILPNQAVGGSGTTRLALSAVDVVTASAPEPSSVLLMLGGFGVLAARRFRRINQ